VAGRRAALRLLLVLVATGVAGMHTLGHPTSDGHAGAADHSTALVIEPMAEAIGAAMTTAVHVDIYGTGMRLDPLTVCLAILAGSLLVLLVVLLVVALGLFEWLVRSGRLTRPGGPLVFPLLCAAGGGLLLTHSHAMFNLKTEFLTELSHAPMGLFGVLMAWGRWLEVRLPPADRRIPGWVWAACMTIFGLILLVYRET